MSGPGLLEMLRSHELLPPSLLAELSRLPAARAADPRDLSRILLQRGLLTRFQLGQLAKGLAKDLRIGPYLLLDRLGAGPLGPLYKAHHGHLKRTVALTVIPADRLPTPAAVRQFYKDFQGITALQHPHLGVIYDAGQTDKDHYLAREHRDLNLALLLEKQGAVPVEQACLYAEQAALALHFLHQRGLAHYALTPATLLLADAGPGQPGVIRVVDPAMGKVPELLVAARDPSRLGELIGTGDHLAPELAMDPQASGPLVDVYSLGCILFHLLTGQPPFPARTALEAMCLHQSSPPPSLHASCPDAPPELELLLSSMLAKTPEDRPSADDVAGTLASMVSDPAPVHVQLTAVPPVAPAPAMNPLALDEDQEDTPIVAPTRKRRRSGGFPWVIAAAGVVALAILIVGLLIGQAKLSSSRSGKPGQRAGTTGTQSGQGTNSAGEKEDEPKFVPVRLNETAQPAPELTPEAARVQMHALRVKEGTAAHARLLRDGKHALVASGQMVRLYDLAEGKLRQEYGGHLKPITALALSPSGKLAASAGRDTLVRIWRTDTGKLEKQLRHTDAVTGLAFSPDDLLLMTATEGLPSETRRRDRGNRGLVLWDVRAGKVVHDFDTPTVPTVAITNDGTHGLASLADRPFMVWPLSIRPNPLPNHKPEVTGQVRLAPLGLHEVLLGTAEGKLLLWDTDQARPSGEFIGHTAPIGDISVATDGRRFVSVASGADMSLRVWDVDAKQEIGKLDLPSAIVSVSLSGDGNHVLTGQEDGSVRLFDLERLVRKPTAPSMPATPTVVDKGAGFTAHKGKINHVNYSGDGKYLLSGGADGVLHLFAAESGKSLRTFDLTDPVHWVGFMEEDRWVVGFTNKGYGRVWETANGNSVTTLRFQNTPQLEISGVGLVSDPPRVLVALEQTVYEFRPKAEGTVMPEQDKKLSKAINVISCGVEGKHFAWGDDMGMVHIQEMNTFKDVANLPTHKGRTTSLAWSGKGQRLVSGGADGIIILRAVQGLQFFRRFTGHKGEVRALSFSADGRRFVSAGVDQTIRVWDSSGRQVYQITAEKQVLGVAFSPEGKHIVTCGDGITRYPLGTSRP